MQVGELNDKSWMTVEKLRTLLRGTLTQPQFVSLCGSYGIEVTQSTISRALKDGKFAKHDVDQRLRPIVLGLEELVSNVWLFQIDFSDVPSVRLLLDIIACGRKIEVTVSGGSNEINSSTPETKNALG